MVKDTFDYRPADNTPADEVAAVVKDLERDSGKRVHILPYRVNMGAVLRSFIPWLAKGR